MAETTTNVFTGEESIICPNCKIPMKYQYAGLYKCEKCGAEQLDDFGLIKRYLDENGPTNALELSEKTGVKRAKISEFLRSGRIEVAESSTSYIHCKGCGSPIRYGDYCASCAHEMHIKGAYVGPSAPSSGTTDTKMRFLDKK